MEVAVRPLAEGDLDGAAAVHARAFPRQGRGIGERLIRSSLSRACDHLAERGQRLKSVLVTTRTDNAAQRLYRRVLGAEAEAVVSGLYSADEVLLVARDPLSHVARG